MYPAKTIDIGLQAMSVNILNPKQKGDILQATFSNEIPWKYVRFDYNSTEVCS